MTSEFSCVPLRHPHESHSHAHAMWGASYLPLWTKAITGEKS